ncbi:MAG: hypothetical protein ACUVV6_03150 [Thermoplasmatota archaeon]
MGRARFVPVVLLLALAPALPSAAGEDTEPPTLEVLSHRCNQTVGRAELVLSGRASDPGSGVALVEVRLNGGVWVAADRNESWSARLRLEEGRNTISVRATDRAGNEALVNLTVIYSTGTGDGYGIAAAIAVALVCAASVSVAALRWGRSKKDI